MNTAVISVKSDPRTKVEAQQIAAQLGFSLSSLVNAFLKQLTRTRTVSFSISNEEPTEYMLQALKESEADRKAGRYRSFANPEDALAYLDQLSKQSRAH